MRREMVDGLEAPEEGAGVEPDEEEGETLLLEEALGGSAPAASRSCRASPALAAAAASLLPGIERAASSFAAAAECGSCGAAAAVETCISRCAVAPVRRRRRSTHVEAAEWSRVQVEALEAAWERQRR
jgi:hypothetical protein